jgi:hypothetical protein
MYSGNGIALTKKLINNPELKPSITNLKDFILLIDIVVLLYIFFLTLGKIFK